MAAEAILFEELEKFIRIKTRYAHEVCLPRVKIIRDVLKQVTSVPEDLYDSILMEMIACFALNSLKRCRRSWKRR